MVAALLDARGCIRDLKPVMEESGCADRLARQSVEEVGSLSRRGGVTRDRCLKAQKLSQELRWHIVCSALGGFGEKGMIGLQMTINKHDPKCH